MSKRLIFVVEGETEKEFVENLLVPRFNNELGVYDITCFKTKRSHGGVSKYSYIKEDILRVVNERDAIVTTMFDFYMIPQDTSGYPEADSKVNHLQQVELMERSIYQDVLESCNGKRICFLPYLELHEFEAMLFSSDAGINEYFKDEADLKMFYSIQKSFPNPEDIDNGSMTAPSKRMEKIIPDYEKPLYGNCMAMSIGLDVIMDKCPHFRNWINRLADLLTSSNLH